MSPSHRVSRSATRFAGLSGAVCGAARPWPVLFVFGLLFPGWVAAASGAELELLGIRVDAAQVEVVFRDTGTGAVGYQLEHAVTAAPPVSWERLEATIQAGVQPGTSRATAARPAGESGFFRVVGLLDGGSEVASAAFAPGALVVTEGGAAGPTLRFSRPYSGILRYTYAGPGFEQAGQVTVSGVTEVSLPAPRLDDDSEPGPLRSLSLRIERVSGGEVALGGPSIVVAEDNDEIWRGVLAGDGSPSFSFVILRTPGGMVRGGVRGDDTGYFPAGDFPAASMVRTDTHFHARVPGIRWREDGAPFAGEVVGDLELEARVGAPEHQVTSGSMSGRFGWSVAVPGRPHLNLVRTGLFVLQREPSPAPTQKVPLTSAQP